MTVKTKKDRYVVIAKGRALVTDSYRRLPHTIYTRQLRADRKLSIRRDPRHPPYPLTPRERLVEDSDRTVEAAAPHLQGHLAGAPLRAPAADASRASAIASWARRVPEYFG